MRQKRIGTAQLLAGAAAAAFAAAAFAALAAEPPQELEDVQIGEAGAVLRVALICSNRCVVAPDDGIAFRIMGVDAALDIDLESRSALARRLTIAPADGASILKIDAAARVDEARVVACDSDSGPAPCIEYKFDVAAGSAAVKSPEPALRAEPPAKVEAKAKPAPQTSTKTAPETTLEKREDVPFIGALIAPASPKLRDEPAEGILYLPQFGPPERLDPPREISRETGAQSSLGVLPANVDIGRPSLINVDRAEMLGDGAAFDFMTESVAILGKSFDIGACEGAKQRLSADAWALEAMIDNAFCKAADGSMEEADADFERLLAYTPDNYEALVGRGLIAIAKGERVRGQGLLQEALNALPPIEESDRIVEAMGRN